MSIQIRRATARDCDDMIRLLGQIANHHHCLRPDIYRNSGAKYGQAGLLEILSDPDTPILVATEEGTFLGYAFCRLERTVGDILLQDRTVLYLDDLCVDESIRGKGIGKVLFQAVKDLAITLNCDAVELNVLMENTSAVQFYLSRGMKTQKCRMELSLKEIERPE